MRYDRETLHLRWYMVKRKYKQIQKIRKAIGNRLACLRRNLKSIHKIKRHIKGLKA